ncbi:MAG: Metalloprotease [Frankiales bacterium]|nr:Metalloprotease [Frankiales bacterium]
MRHTRLSRPRAAVTAAVAATALLAAPALAAGEGAGEQPDKSATEIALDDVRENPAKYKVEAADVDELVVSDAYTSAHNQVTHVYVRQTKGGTPIAGSSATVNVDRRGKVIHTGSRLIKGVDAQTSGTAQLTAVQAFEAAAKGLRLGAPKGLRLLGSSKDGAVKTALLSDAGLAAGPVPAALTYQAVGTTVRLAWVVEIEEKSGLHWWVAAVDAEDGRLLQVDDLVVSEKSTDDVHHDGEAPTRAVAGAAADTALVQEAAANGLQVRSADTDADALAAPGLVADGSAYRVYQQPLESPNDGPRTVVRNPADPTFSRFGWHDLDGKPGPDTTTTTGNNINAYADTVQSCEGLATGVCAPAPQNNEADPASQPNAADLQFDYLADERLTPATYRDAAVTNLFYWTNTIHDFTARYGFTEAAGNFQVLNYDGQGKGGDPVQAEAQDGSGVLNANFATPAEGSSPRMQMYLWVPGAENVLPNPQTNVPTRPEATVRDGDFDAGVITHEYGHGVSNRLTGGPSTSGCLSTSTDQEQMGEGWSDFLAYTMTMRAQDALDLGRTPRGVGTYVLYQEGRSAQGIRQSAYSTDLRIDYATYDTIKDSSVAAPHGVGWVWASMLWEVYWGLVEQHGFNPDLDASWETGGNNLAAQLVIDGMKFQPCRPGFVDGRDAILAADQALTGGENRCTLWAAFAKRGLGTNASQGNVNSKTDGREGFKVPADC